jgi:hypothetical protein
MAEIFLEKDPLPANSQHHTHPRNHGEEKSWGLGKGRCRSVRLFPQQLMKESILTWHSPNLQYKIRRDPK